MTASFGQLVKEHRIEIGMTQQQLADLVGRSPSTIRSWERDRATPNDRAVLESVASALGIDGSLLAGLAGVALLDMPDMPDDLDAPEGVLAAGMADGSPADVAHPVAEPTSRPPFPAPLVVHHDLPEADLESFKTPGPAKADEPRSYLLETDRRPDTLRLGPEKPVQSEPDERWQFEREEPVDDEPDPEAPPLENESGFEFESDAEMPDGQTRSAGVDSEVEPPGSEAESLDDEPDEEAADEAGEPTQILIAAPPVDERLLGVATATDVEFVAEPRPRPVIEPESVEPEPTQLSDRAPLIESLGVAPTVPLMQPTTPVPAVGRPAPIAQPRTQTLEQGRPVGPDSYLEDPKELRGYRIRAALTTATLIAMLLIARWAWAGFREQLSGILDTLTTGF
jgi:transcriptional regulator with XRE-family HTH domain